MQCHQRNERAFLVLIRVAYERRMIEKFTQRLSAISRIARRIHQLLKIFNSGKRLGSSLFFQNLDVSCAVDEELDDLRQGCRSTGRAKALNRDLVSL